MTGDSQECRVTHHFAMRLTCVACTLRYKHGVRLAIHSVGHGFDSYAATLGKLSTPLCLSHQAVDLRVGIVANGQRLDLCS